jgi:hypothetical protein
MKTLTGLGRARGAFCGLRGVGTTVQFDLGAILEPFPLPFPLEFVPVGVRGAGGVLGYFDCGLVMVVVLGD